MIIMHGKMLDLRQSELVETGLDFIDRIEDKSDSLITRYRVYMKNGYSVSVIRGFGTYGAEENLFEVAVYDKNGQMLPLFDGDAVQGWLTEQEVVDIIINVGSNNNLVV